MPACRSSMSVTRPTRSRSLRAPSSVSRRAKSSPDKKAPRFRGALSHCGAAFISPGLLPPVKGLATGRVNADALDHLQVQPFLSHVGTLVPQTRLSMESQSRTPLQVQLFVVLSQV